MCGLGYFFQVTDVQSEWSISGVRTPGVQVVASPSLLLRKVRFWHHKSAKVQRTSRGTLVQLLQYAVPPRMSYFFCAKVQFLIDNRSINCFNIHPWRATQLEVQDAQNYAVETSCSQFQFFFLSLHYMPHACCSNWRSCKNFDTYIVPCIVQYHEAHGQWGNDALLNICFIKYFRYSIRVVL